VCVCVCACPRERLRNHMRDLYQFFVLVAYGHSSVLLQQGDEIRKERGNLGGGFFPIGNSLYGPYNGINFLMKDRRTDYA